MANHTCDWQGTSSADDQAVHLESCRRPTAVTDPSYLAPLLTWVADLSMPHIRAAVPSYPSVLLLGLLDAAHKTSDLAARLLLLHPQRRL